ncbi:unnamed protein product [Notodromas monacha]|uniref:Ephexin-1 n=1 Tax=Notodromas monacha TaxID=399045 RepID=A0A7R9BZR1_9CRUS|nr:unnamed protein product [Notodromas monacha]CAG0923569.1 unnamed protein product [Notodromas monacha]
MSTLAALELAGPRSPHRTLWCELPQVQESGVLVRDVSEALLCDLEKRWAENIVIEDISDIILAHAQDHFGVYVKYCSNKIHQDRLLNNLKETSPQFCEVLRELETDPVCQSLSMHSFLMLPMQRITRLPLLIDAIFHRHPPSSEEYENCKNALTVLNKVVHECNEGARKMERLEELLVLSRQLDFGTGVKALPLMSASRWLVKRGQLTRLLWKESDTMKRAGGLGRNRPHKQPLHLFLFTDVLIITKKKGEEQGYTVLDYCSRNMIQIQEEFDETMLPGKLPDGINKAHVLACPGDSERARWTEAVTPRRSSDPNEVIYEEWDCPQVQAIHPYTAQQPDELSLETSDVVNVFKKTADGWYQGERIRDGERGWFPGNFCEEIASAHVRARNLRQRYRLLVLSGSYLEEKRRVSVGKAAMFYVPLAADAATTTTTTAAAATAVGNNNNNNNKRRERKSASSVFAPAM